MIGNRLLKSAVKAISGFTKEVVSVGIDLRPSGETIVGPMRDLGREYSYLRRVIVVTTECQIIVIFNILNYYACKDVFNY